MKKILNEWKKFLKEGSAENSKLAPLAVISIANMIKNVFEVSELAQIHLEGMGDVEGVLYQTPGPSGSPNRLVAAVKLNPYNMFDKKALKREVRHAQENARTILGVHLPGVQGGEEMKWNSQDHGFFLTDGWHVKETGKELSPHDGPVWAVASALNEEDT